MGSLGKVFQGIEGARGDSASSGSTKTTGKAISSVTGNNETDSKDGTTEVTETGTGQTSKTNTGQNTATTISTEFQNGEAVARLLDHNAPLRGFSVAGLDRSQEYKDPVAAQNSFAAALNPSQFTNSLPPSGSMGQAPINSQQGVNNAWGSVGGSAQDWVTNSYNWLTGNNNTGNSSNSSVGSGHYHAPNDPATTKVSFNNLSEKQAHALQHYALDNQLTYSYLIPLNPLPI